MFVITKMHTQLKRSLLPKMLTSIELEFPGGQGKTRDCGNKAVWD